MRTLLAVLTVCTLMLAAAPQAQLSQGSHGQSFDFGHVGIDFKVYHDFPLINNGTDTVRIDSLEVTCDCTSIAVIDSVLEPGDTIYFQLRFETKDLYGPTNRSFTIFTDSETQPTAKFFYLSIVGQWYNGIVPSPSSLFFLPPQKSRTIEIRNSEFDRVSMTVLNQFDSTFTVTPVKTEATSGDVLRLEVRPVDELPSGTHLSNFTIGIMDSDGSEVSRLTIPVKIARY